MSIQTLGKQSLIYGFGHILTRLITFFLLPLYTHIFTLEEYGVVSLAYAFMGFALILYRYGMDSALMKYAIQKEGQERGEYISTIYGLQVISSVVFSCILFFSRNIIAKIVLGVINPNGSLCSRECYYWMHFGTCQYCCFVLKKSRCRLLPLI